MNAHIPKQNSKKQTVRDLNAQKSPIQKLLVKPLHEKNISKNSTLRTYIKNLVTTTTLKITRYISVQDRYLADDKVFCAMVSAAVIKKILMGYTSSKKIVSNNDIYNRLMLYCEGYLPKSELPITEKNQEYLAMSIMNIINMIKGFDGTVRISFIDETIEEIKRKEGIERREEHSVVQKSRSVFPYKVGEGRCQEKHPADTSEESFDIDSILGDKLDTELLDPLEIFSEDVPDRCPEESVLLPGLDLLEGFELEEEKEEGGGQTGQTEDKGRDGRRDKRVEQIKEIIKKKIYPELKKLFLYYRIDPNKIDWNSTPANNKIVEFARILGISLEDIRIIMDRKTLENPGLPVGSGTKIFCGDIAIALYKLKNMALDIDAKIKRIKDKGKTHKRNS